LQQKMSQKAPLITRDVLAIERTRLANERTFLAYFRTAVVFLSAGFAILEMSALEEIRPLGWFLTGLSPLILAVGIGRLIYIRAHIKKYYQL
jgi:putative membrane protein